MTSRRYIKIASEIERHRPVQYTAHARDVIVDLCIADPVEHLMYGVGVREHVVRRLPVGVLICVTEVREPERCSISEGAAKIGRSGACVDRRFESVNDLGRIVTE